MDAGMMPCLSGILKQTIRVRRISGPQKMRVREISGPQWLCPRRTGTISSSSASNNQPLYMDVCVLRCTPGHIPRYMGQTSNNNKLPR